MYVCLCNGFTDRQVRTVAEKKSTVSTIYRRLGCRPQCGKCVPFVREMLVDLGALAAAGDDNGDTCPALA